MTRMLTKDDVVGIFPPVATPFTKDEELDLGALEAEIEFFLALNVTGLCFGGSTGEGHALTADELGQICAKATEVINGRVPVMAGIISTTTRDAVAKAKAAAAGGAQAVMVTPPIYQIASQDGLYDFYSTIHRESGLPTMVYNVNANTPVNPELMRRMAENQEETGLIATKESIGSSLEWVTELLETIGDKISVTWAHDWILYPGLALGASGSISGAGAVLPRHCQVMWDALQDSNIPLAQKMHFAITDVASQISRYNWPAGIKTAINLQEGRNVGPCRAPFDVIPDEQIKRIGDALARADVALKEVG